MTKGYQVEIIRRVYDNDNGQFLTISPSGDFPGNVVVLAEKDEKEYFGPLHLDLPAEFMRKLGEALIAAANEAEAV